MFLQTLLDCYQFQIAKMYDPNNPEDDMREAQEEINRMREHVFKEADLDGNHVLDQNEFEALTKKEEFNKDEGWKVSFHFVLNLQWLKIVAVLFFIVFLYMKHYEQRLLLILTGIDFHLSIYLFYTGCQFT